MNNTYGVLTYRVSVEDILEMYTGEDAIFYGNPYKMTLDDVDEVIQYFEDIEEYEICSELVDCRNSLDLDLFNRNILGLNESVA